MNNIIKYILKYFSYLFLIVTTIGFILKLYTLYVNVKFMYIDNYITLVYLIFSNVTEYFSILFWGLGISFSILLLIKLLTDEKIEININTINEISDEINLIEIGKYQENNEIKINTIVGEDYRNEEIWICSVCNTSNEIYMIKCKKCGKTIE
jgi:hypothetical protein